MTKPMFELIRGPTQLHHMMNHTDNAHWQDDLCSIVMVGWIKATYDWSQHIGNEHLETRWTKPTSGAEQLNYQTTPMEEIVSKNKCCVPSTWSILQFKLPMKTKNSTMELHLRQRINAQGEVRYCFSMLTVKLLKCSTIHESNYHTKLKNWQMWTIAHSVVYSYSRASKYQSQQGLWKLLLWWTCRDNWLNESKSNMTHRL